jgi:Uncharacterised nucleotidyltransferase
VTAAEPTQLQRQLAQQLRIDTATVRICVELARASIPYALLKGPTTARWLYDVPRPYRDIDLLVPGSRLRAAVRTLKRADLAHRIGGRLGEDCPHSLLLATPSGIEVDLHVTLPTMARPRGRDADHCWFALGDHFEWFDLDGASVQALDPAARCVVLALHAVANATDVSWAIEDLQRAGAFVDQHTWQQAIDLAGRLGVQPVLTAGRRLAGGTDPLAQDVPPGVRLLLQGAGASARAWQAILDLPWYRRPGALLHEAFPSPAFIRRAVPGMPPGLPGLALGHLRRWRRIAGESRR